MIYHDGIVVGINNRHVQVKILSRSACNGCHARVVCSAADMEEKIIDAVPVSEGPLHQGDPVTLIMEEKQGRLAVFYGFFLPFLVMIAVLFGAYGAGCGELASALLGIGSLVPYYFLLYVSRKRIEKDFIFKVERKNKFADMNEVKE